MYKDSCTHIYKCKSIINVYIEKVSEAYIMCNQFYLQPLNNSIIIVCTYVHI